MNPFINPAFSKYYQQFPLVLIDIGASGGFKENWVRANRYLQMIGFEPDDRSLADLMKSEEFPNIKYLNTALYKEKRSLDFYLTRKQQLSSMLEPNREFLDRFPEAERFDVVGTKRISTDTLDSQLQEHKINDVDFIKLDTQGSELFILQGATEILRNSVFGLEIELEFVPMYDDQPLFAEVDNFVKDFGFQLFDLRPCYWKRLVGKNCSRAKGQIVFADAIYLKTIESLDVTLRKAQDNDLTKAKVLKALSICILYDHRDYALEVIEANHGFFQQKERELLVKAIQGRCPFASVLATKIPKFRGRGKVSNAFYLFWKILQPDYWKAVVYLEDGQRLEKY